LPIASRVTVPACWAVMLASIFIASIVATVWPAPPGHLRPAASPPAGGDVAGLVRSAFSAALTSVAVRIPHRHRAQLPVQRRHHRAVARARRARSRLQLDDQRDALLQLDGIDLGLRP
jgi:hypothetical protein